MISHEVSYISHFRYSRRNWHVESLTSVVLHQKIITRLSKLTTTRSPQIWGLRFWIHVSSSMFHVSFPCTQVFKNQSQTNLPSWDVLCETAESNKPSLGLDRKLKLKTLPPHGPNTETSQLTKEGTSRQKENRGSHGTSRNPMMKIWVPLAKYTESSIIFCMFWMDVCFKATAVFFFVYLDDR